MPFHSLTQITASVGRLLTNSPIPNSLERRFGQEPSSLAGHSYVFPFLPVQGCDCCLLFPLQELTSPSECLQLFPLSSVCPTFTNISREMMVSLARGTVSCDSWTLYCFFIACQEWQRYNRVTGRWKCLKVQSLCGPKSLGYHLTPSLILSPQLRARDILYRHHYLEDAPRSNSSVSYSCVVQVVPHACSHSPGDLLSGTEFPFLSSVLPVLLAAGAVFLSMRPSPSRSFCSS